MSAPFGVEQDWQEAPADSADFWDFADGATWTDGLPGIPPTQERIERMLSPFDLDPDDGLGPVPPGEGDATFARIAANAVYAGMAPALMPLLLTALEAALQPQFNLDGIQATTHPVAPLIIVHGAAVEALGINSGSGLFGPGARANATLGRAMRLVLMNIGGARPGHRDRATHGQPSKFSFCIGEAAATSPWDAYHTDRLGLDPAVSAVTVFGSENPHNVNDHVSTDAVGLLGTCASTIANLGANTAHYSHGEIHVVLSPEHAATIATSGFSRRDVQLYLYERARLSVPVLSSGGMSGMDAWTPWKHAVARDPAASLPPLNDPDDLRVLVAGGPGKHSVVLQSFGATRSVTMPVAERYVSAWEHARLVPASAEESR
jgi:hypothetical protein